MIRRLTAMRLRLRDSLHLALLLATVSVTAQKAPAPEPHKDAASPTPMLHSGTQLVLVDVTVQDSGGQPVHNLKKEDFVVTEDKAPQTIRSLEAFSADQPKKPAFTMPKLPPGTFTDYSPAATGGPLNILLLDTLNTPMADQMYVRYQLQQYVKQAQPGTRIAIFGLTTHLILLQGFTADPEVLKSAVEHKLIPRASVLLDDAATGTATDDSLSGPVSITGPAIASAAANLAQFQAESASFQLGLRVRYTVDAFHNLGRYLTSFPGRKNIIWFSGSFPLDVMPDDTLQDPFATLADYSDELREASYLLTQAQVAVYPIDARGLMTNPAFSASQGSSMARPGAMLNAINKFSQSQIAEHATMDRMAEDTGGQAFYNTNGLWQATQKAIAAGSNYYTLSYTPTNKKFDGNYRKIRVELTGAAAANGYKLTFRRGYFAPDEKHPIQPAADSHAEQNYAHAAMDRGAPEPADILFKVRVLPASAGTEPKLAPDNTPGPIGGLTGPFRRFDVDMVTLGNSFRTELQQATGRWTGKFSFDVLVYDAQGKLLNVAGNGVSLDLTPETHATFDRKPIAMHLEVSVPVRTDAYLRIGLHDIPTNRFGVVEIPVASVAHLPPPVYPQAAAPAGPATAPPPATATPPAAAPAPPR